LLRRLASSFRLLFHFLQFLLGRGGLLVPVVVIVIARAAPHFRRFIANKGDDGMIREATAFDAKVVDDIT
jgi:hypothetical protein